jgi:cytochrome c oxidase subunit IV
MAKLYCQVVGIVLLLLGVLGLVGFGIAGFLSIDEPAEIVVHFITGALATYAGFSSGDYGRLALLYARVFGIIYLLLAIVGFIFQGQDILSGALRIHLDLGCNLAHLLLGVLGIAVGYVVRPSPAAMA